MRSKSSTHVELNQMRKTSENLYGVQYGRGVWQQERQRRGKSANCSPLGFKGVSTKKKMKGELNVFETSMNGQTNSRNQNLQANIEDEQVYVHYVKTNSNNITLNGSLNGVTPIKIQSSKPKTIKAIPEPLMLVEANKRRDFIPDTAYVYSICLEYSLK